MITIKLHCPRGHCETLRFQGVDQAFAIQVAKILDGTSKAFVYPPESSPAKCPMCFAFVTATVEDDAAPAEEHP
jgi:hypothetical protein